jgi:hypothetical protein
MIRLLAKIPLALALIIFTISAVTLFAWEVQRLSPDGSVPWARWARTISMTAIVATAITLLLIGARFAHVAGAA